MKYQYINSIHTFNEQRHRKYFFCIILNYLLIFLYTKAVSKAGHFAPVFTDYPWLSSPLPDGPAQQKTARKHEFFEIAFFNYLK
jgi:hypothetical protein